MQRDGWRLSLLAREALRNIFGSGSRMYALLALAVLTGAGSSAYIAMEATTLQQEVRALSEAGRNVVVFTALNNDAPASIDRHSCEALAGQRGVPHAGSLEAAGHLDVLPLGDHLPAMRASASLFPELGTVDMLIGHNLPAGSTETFIVRHQDEMAVAARARPYPQDLGTGASVTLPPLPKDSHTEKCVVMLDAYSDVDVAIPVIAAQLNVDGHPVTGEELLTATNEPVSDFLGRPTRWFPLLLGCLGAAATAITLRLRSSEIAVYRMSGTSPASIMVLLTFEALLVSGVAVFAAALASLVLLPHYLALTVPLLWGLALGGIWAITALLSSVDLAFRRPSDLAKDR